MSIPHINATTVASSTARPGRWALLSLSLTMLLSALGTSIANVGLPTLAGAYAVPFQDVQWVVLAYLLTITTFIVSLGRLGDLIGPRRLLLAGLSLFVLASLACALAPTLWPLVIARSFQGLGAAAMMALSMAMVGQAVAKEQTGSAMGLLGTMSATGTALGPTLGGWLIARYGWPAMFLINLPLGLLALLLVWRLLPADRRPTAPRPVRFDLAGTVLLALALLSYALAMTQGRGHFGASNALLLAVALGSAWLFRVVEGRVASPLLRLALLRNPILGGGFASSALVTAVVMATLVIGPFYLSYAFALDAAQVGLWMSSGPVVAALVGVPAGRLVDRIGAGRMQLVALFGMLIGALLLASIPARLGVVGYISPLLLVTAGYAVFQAANNTAVMTSVMPDQRGLVSALLNLSRNLGLITGASLMAAVFAWGRSTGDAGASALQTAERGLHLSFALAAILIVTAMGLLLWSRRRSRQVRRCSSLRPHPSATETE
ncbi:MAG: MFS transporter [Lysobacterales bacterium]